jgi:hypothetical protein
MGRVFSMNFLQKNLFSDYSGFRHDAKMTDPVLAKKFRHFVATLFTFTDSLIAKKDLIFGLIL